MAALKRQVEVLETHNKKF
jgi:hypothetical protein